VVPVKEETEMSFNVGAGREPELWKGLVAGAAGGIGATVAMTAFQSLWTHLYPRLRTANTNGRPDRPPDGTPMELLDAGTGTEEDAEMSESATEWAAAKLSRGFFGYELDSRERHLAGTAIHFGFGTAVGAVYGVMAEYSPAIVRGDGVPFGTGLMAVADDVAVPALGLSRPGRETPWSTHLYALCSHTVYGAVLEGIRRSLRRML
jgi:hypothetical protein